MSRFTILRTHLSFALSCLSSVLLVGLLATGVKASSDNTLFHIECPADTTVSCDAELWDLSIYGTAYIYGYGSPEPAGDPVSVDYDLNTCGSGTITRTWVAYDYAGNSYSCSQVIYVAGGYGSINWPPDYVIHDCTPATDPEDLPPPYDFPEFGNAECAQYMMNYEDLVFDINPPACRKILRKWTVIDWCQYDPNAWNPTGYWEHTQIIKIVPENAPVITCPADVTASAGSDCTGGYVEIPPATGMTDCGADVIISNKSPYATSGGADASGFYPLGTTKVVFVANDGCGGTTTCSMYVTVKDLKAPTPVCYYGISVSLMQMPEGYFMDLSPEFFDKGSFDNCTPDDKLIFDIEPKRVDCSDIGTIPVKVFVTDQSGNSAYCNTIVHVQDNNGICPPTNGVISGEVTTADGSFLEEVEVMIQQTAVYDMTDDEGHYDIANVPFGHSYTVQPTYLNGYSMEGISTLDLIILLKHILGIESINDPYLYIAADVDQSGLVNVHDLLELKDIIVKNHFQITTGTNWQFVDAAAEFPAGTNPMSEPLPTVYTISNFTADMTDLDFIGVKSGDLSGEANYPSFGSRDVKVRSAPLGLLAYDSPLSKGDQVEIRISASEWYGIAGYQVGLSVDPEKARLLGAEGTAIGLSGQQPLSSVSVNGSSVAAIWFDTAPLQSGVNTLLRIRVEALADTRVSEILSLSESGARPEAYSESYDVIDLDLQFTDQPSVTGTPVTTDQVLVVGESFPNPFSNITRIPVYSGSEFNARIDVFDASGRVVHSRLQNLLSGQNQVLISATDLAGTGVFMVRITAGDQVNTVRIVSQTWD